MENLGKQGKDKITGFIGIVTAKCYHLYGCAQYGLTPPVDKDGKEQNVKWIDEGRLEIIGAGLILKMYRSKIMVAKVRIIRNERNRT